MLLLILFQVGGGFGFLVPMLLVFGVFYLLLIRPQQKKQRQLQSQIADLKAGDKIVTTGGIIATITAVKDTSFLVRSADKSILEIARSAVAGIDTEEKK
ncbi:MAG TPA: preprotein translocase subunit YajC [Pyrinomonadaceae bacterium]|jgi:preprotein translocase subunit YajC